MCLRRVSAPYFTNNGIAQIFLMHLLTDTQTFSVAVKLYQQIDYRKPVNEVTLAVLGSY